MDLRRVPVCVLVALGLAGCGPTIDGDESSGSGNSTTDSTSGSTSSSNSEPTVGPCLSPPDTCLSSTGPCLKFDVPPQTTGPETTTMDTDGTGSGTDGTGTDSDSTTTGPCLGLTPDDPPARASARAYPAAPTGAPSRSEVLERLGSALPADVLERLKDDR